MATLSALLRVLMNRTRSKGLIASIWRSLPPNKARVVDRWTPILLHLREEAVSGSIGLAHVGLRNGISAAHVPEKAVVGTVQVVLAKLG